jgi:pimeloyl-ACP methyl ester carboxylesterase
MMKIVYIHGASATSESFNYLRDYIKGDDLALDYNSAAGFLNNLEVMKDAIRDLDSIFLVAHSLGGIYALFLAHEFPDKVIGAVTLSTPYGGSKAADYAKFFLPFSRLMRDIGPHSEPMVLASMIPIRHPWTNVVTTKGDSPFMTEPNDGVVTIESMRKHSHDMILVDLELNHYEVVMSPKTVKIITDKIKGVHDNIN